MFFSLDDFSAIVAVWVTFTSLVKLDFTGEWTLYNALHLWTTFWQSCPSQQFCLFHLPRLAHRMKTFLMQSRERTDSAMERHFLQPCPYCKIPLFLSSNPISLPGDHSWKLFLFYPHPANRIRLQHPCFFSTTALVDCHCLLRLCLFHWLRLKTYLVSLTYLSLGTVFFAAVLAAAFLGGVGENIEALLLMNPLYYRIVIAWKSP